MQVLTTILVASTLFLPPQPEGDLLVWHPAEGTQLRRSIELTHERTNGDATLKMNGNEQDAGSGMVRTTTGAFQALDTFGKAREGENAGPAALTRTFEEVSESSESEGQPEGVEVRGADGGSGLLQGLGVDFSFDEESEAWDAGWDSESDGESKWLEGLSADMDCSAFLPDEAVSEGDQWDVDLAAAADLLWPGGEIFVEHEAPEDDLPEGAIAIHVPGGGDIRRLDELKGDVTARYAGRRDVDGRSLGVIEIELDLEGTLDVAEDFREASSMDQHFDSAELTRSFEGEGEILWDLEGNHMAALTFASTGDSEVDAVWDAGGDTMELEVEFQGDGEESRAIEIQVERVDAE